MTVEVADVLDKAADLIDPAKGGRWIRGAESDDKGGLCVMGALKLVSPPKVPTWSRFTTAVAAVADVVGRHPDFEIPAGYSVTGWNDGLCLDGHEAANVLRKAAEIERAGVAEAGRMGGDRASAAPTSPDDGVGQQIRLDPAASHPGTP